MTPAKNVRSHSDVEPDTPSPSITHQPKASRLGSTGTCGSSDLLYRGQTIPTRDILDMIKDEMQSHFRSILKEENATGNNSLLSKLEVLKIS